MFYKLLRIFIIDSSILNLVFWLVSAQDTFAVILGMVLLVGGIVLNYEFYKRLVIKKTKGKRKK